MGLEEIRLNPLAIAKPRLSFGKRRTWEPSPDDLRRIVVLDLSQATGTLHRPLAAEGRGAHINYLA